MFDGNVGVRQHVVDSTSRAIIAGLVDKVCEVLFVVIQQGTADGDFCLVGVFTVNQLQISRYTGVDFFRRKYLDDIDIEVLGQQLAEG